jgi:hypothetical protein
VKLSHIAAWLSTAICDNFTLLGVSVCLAVSEMSRRFKFFFPHFFLFCSIRESHPQGSVEGKMKIALIGAGMFGADVHLRAYANLQISGLAPLLGRIGLDQWARELAPVSFELAAVAARSQASAQRAGDAMDEYRKGPKAAF